MSELVITEHYRTLDVADIRVEHLIDHCCDSDLVVDRYRVKTVGHYHIEVLPQLFNWRIHTIGVDGEPGIDWSHRYWCYAGRGQSTFVAAVLAAAAWDGGNDTEPVGWVKSWDGRRNGEGPVKPRRSS